MLLKQTDLSKMLYIQCAVFVIPLSHDQ